MQQADCDGIDLQWMLYSSDEESEDDFDREGGAPVKFFTHELSWKGRLRRLLVRNPTSRMYSTIFDLFAKVIICLLYFVRVCIDDPDKYACSGQQCVSNGTKEEGKSGFTSTNINWHVILWVERPLALWIMEVVMCVFTLSKAILFVCIATKGTVCDHILTKTFLLEIACSVPLILTIFYPHEWRNLFVPLFLNCWLAQVALRRLMNDLHLTKQRFQTMAVTLNQQICFLTVTLFCLIFTTICGIQHIQRSSSERPLNMFEAVYFVIVTFSTVGYGDISPDIWLGQLFMFLMICVAFVFLPKQLEEIGSTWAQRKKTGGDYSKRKAIRSKHVVVCASSFTADVVMNFLNEFFEHPKLEEHTVILMSSDDLENTMLFILKDPKWTNRVVYIKGSPLKDIDLKRCRINEAEAVFFLLDKTCPDQEKADQHTILRSWAVKDFAPKCRQYIQLFHATNKLHVRFAEHVVCEDEFKFALLANNCLYPGLSTLVTLILHTSRGKEGSWADEAWQQVYGRHSGNEIYHIQLNRSIFFHKFEGQPFVQASSAVHQSLGVCLLAVLDSMEAEPCLKLNPGPEYILKGTDYCFYMSLTKEEYSRVTTPLNTESPGPLSAQRQRNIERLASNLQQWLQTETDSIDEDEDEESLFNTITSNMGNSLTRKMRDGIESLPLMSKSANGTGPTNTSPNEKGPEKTSGGRETTGTPETGTLTLERMYETYSPDRVFQQYGDVGQDSCDEETSPPPWEEYKLWGFMTGPLPSTMPVGTKRISCHLHCHPRSPCCLKWGQDCEHCTFKNAADERWDNQLIIVSVNECSPAVYNFIVPLRSSYLSLGSLSPIIIMVTKEPDALFVETIAHFPLVFWMKGRLKSLDDLLKAGIRKALHLVISNIGAVHGTGTEECWEDAETVVMVQKITRLFPTVNIVTEMNEASNMRFMHFQAHDTYTQEISRLEKRLKEKTTSNLPYMFRLPFAAGQVFSSAMLDRLLYQTFVKGYLISFVRLLLGIDAQEKSGHLSSVRIKRATIAQFPTYGDLYQGLCSTTGEIPIAIYRTEKRGGADTDEDHLPAPVHVPVNNNNNAKLRKCRSSRSCSIFRKVERDHGNLSELINDRLKRLKLGSGEEPYEIKKPPKTLSYVIVNPSPKRKLRNGDIIYVVQPSSMVAVPSKLKWRSPARNAASPTRNARQRCRREFSHPPAYSDLGRGPRVSWRLGPNQPLRKLVTRHEGFKTQRFRSKSESFVEDEEEEEEEEVTSLVIEEEEGGASPSPFSQSETSLKDEEAASNRTLSESSSKDEADGKTPHRGHPAAKDRQRPPTASFFKVEGVEEEEAGHHRSVPEPSPTDGDVTDRRRPPEFSFMEGGGEGLGLSASESSSSSSSTKNEDGRERRPLSEVTFIDEEEDEDADDEEDGNGAVSVSFSKVRKEKEPGSSSAEDLDGGSTAC